MSTFLFGSVNLFRFLELRLGNFEIAAIDRAEKAGLVAFMTGSANLINFDQQRVAVAIERDVPDCLRMAAGLAFHPKCLARPAPEMRLAGSDGFFQGSAIHPRHHQHPASGLFLDNGGNQPVGIEFQSVIKVHTAPAIAHKIERKGKERLPVYAAVRKLRWRRGRTRKVLVAQLN